MTARRRRMAVVCRAYGMTPDEYRRLSMGDASALLEQLHVEQNAGG